MKTISAIACSLVLAIGVTFDAGAAPAGRASVLLSAIDSGDTASVKALIPLSDINSRFDSDKGDTPLTAAARKGHAQIVRLLLDAGAAIEGKNKSGGTALLIAAQGGKIDCVRVLIKAGADLETKWQGRTPLLQAARWGHAEVIRELLAAGADRKAKSEGMDAEGFARKYGQDAALAALADSAYAPIKPKNSAAKAAPASPSAFDGAWEDTRSGRCHMTAKTSADGVTRFEVRWADSASTDNVWTFSGRWKNGALTFSDCSHTLETDENGMETSKVTYTSGRGSVLYQGDRLFWDNYADNICRDCTFIRVPE